MRVILLFGPPGVGKSTIINFLQEHRGQFNMYIPYDLETITVHSHEPSTLEYLRYKEVQRLFAKAQDYGRTSATLVVGAAALDPALDYGRHTTKILLSADQLVYDQRRKDRDQGQPGKAMQKRHSMNAWVKGADYDRIIDTTNLSVLETVRAICRTKH